MNKIISTGIGLLLAALNVSAVAHAVDVKSERYSAEAEFTLYLSSIGYSFNDDDSARNEADANGLQHADWRYADIQTSFTDWSDNSAALRLTAGIVDAQPKSTRTRGTRVGMTALDKASKTTLVIDSPDTDSGDSASGSQLGASTGPRLKLAVGVGTTAMEAESSLEDELNAGSLDQAEYTALLDETDNNNTSSTIIDLEDYLERPSLSIGVNYAF